MTFRFHRFTLSQESVKALQWTLDNFYRAGSTLSKRFSTKPYFRRCFTFAPRHSIRPAAASDVNGVLHAAHFGSRNQRATGKALNDAFRYWNVF